MLFFFAKFASNKYLLEFIIFLFKFFSFSPSKNFTKKNSLFLAIFRTFKLIFLKIYPSNNGNSKGSNFIPNFHLNSAKMRSNFPMKIVSKKLLFINSKRFKGQFFAKFEKIIKRKIGHNFLFIHKNFSKHEPPNFFCLFYFSANFRYAMIIIIKIFIFKYFTFLKSSMLGLNIVSK